MIPPACTISTGDWMNRYAAAQMIGSATVKRRIVRIRDAVFCQSITPITERKFAYMRDQLGTAAHKVEPSTAMAPTRKIIAAHSPNVSVYMRDRVTIISLPFGTSPWG